ncbi:hypothetical protein B1748_09165 [Paenibacillus sp. MY03]|uniref:hypothetical protein n=1 Tax=Paenibacillus sp. MY03 TaxID=302980 RepID=UPI000B3C09D3|nr:hypothetical protein [Paenibacillus sp. MY03]OUS77299.1 hypothetical protein B1748_09165 [Paenibacillus sp. MY03]
MSNNKLFRNLDNINPTFWRNLQVRFDALHNNQGKEQFRITLTSISAKELGELSSALSLPIADLNKEQLIEGMLVIDSEKQLLVSLLRDFTNRRKNTIIQYYDLHTKGQEKIYETPTAQLFSLYMESPALLYEIYTFHLWSVKGSGSLLSAEAEGSDKKINKTKTEKIAVEKGYQDKLCDNLFKQTGRKNKYRVFSYAQFKERMILLLYKRVNDTSIPDFEENVRNQEVNALMFDISWGNQTVEMKAATLGERKGIKQYVEDTFDTVLTELKSEVFRDYDAKVFKAAVLQGTTATGTPVDDFLIDRITFRGSPLKNAPEVTLQLKDIDIWPSVMDAHEKGAVNVKSLKDIAYMSVHSAKASRTIRSIIKENGNIVFSMDDSRMDEATKVRLNQKFSEKFGIPLFQEITNEKFVAGKADLFNYVLTNSSADALREPEEKQALQELQVAGLLTVQDDYRIYCLNEECSFQDKAETGNATLEECPSCKEKEFGISKSSSILTNIKNLTSAVRNQLEHICVGEEWIVLKESTRKYNSNQYNFYNYERARDGKPLQVLITDQVIPGRVVKQLIKQMTPLFVIFVGKQEKDIEAYNNECIQAMTFGEVFSIESTIAKTHFNKLYADLELRSKNFNAKAAYEANISITKEVGDDPTKVGREYTDTEFEDDVYCLLKDIFVNTVKWGQEMKGQAVPEGVFSISYRKKKGNNLVGHKFAFSYDCKLTRKAEGYNLTKSEQRKAVEYVDTLNNSDYIASYSMDNQLTAHIFISNRLRSAQIDGMIRYFEEQLGDDYDAMPVFLESDLLMYLHTWYRQKEEELRQAPNNFMAQLYELFKEPGLITKDKIDRIINKALDPSLRELEFLDMGKLSKDITE